MRTFKAKRAYLWAGGMALLIGGFFTAAVVLPTQGEPYGGNAAEVQLPRMVNVPGPWAPNLQLDVGAEPAEAGNL